MTAPVPKGRPDGASVALMAGRLGRLGLFRPPDRTSEMAQDVIESDGREDVRRRGRPPMGEGLCAQTAGAAATPKPRTTILI